MSLDKYRFKSFKDKFSTVSEKVETEKNLDKVADGVIEDAAKVESSTLQEEKPKRRGRNKK